VGTREAVMRKRDTAFKSVSYSAIALLARWELLEFARVVVLERDGRMVRRHVSRFTAAELAVMGCR
jgi:hypothetical protein